jgi:uncharacterized repeat protein (TIGR03847 family)
VADDLVFEEPERITFATRGATGQRTFLLQAREGPVTCTLKLEKTQVAAIAQYFGKLLADLPRPGHLPEDLELEEPAEPAWVVGSIGISFEAELDRFLLVAEEAVGEDELGATARLRLTREQAAALAIRGTQLVEAGRPPCPLCGYPLDPRGHACPRTNGHRPPLT